MIGFCEEQRSLQDREYVLEKSSPVVVVNLSHSREALDLLAVDIEDVLE